MHEVETDQAVTVPRYVFRSVTRLRDLGTCNLFDTSCCKRAWQLMGEHDTLAWVRTHREAYARGILQGMRADDD